MGLFDKRKSIPRRDLLSHLRKDRGSVPGTGGRRFGQKERMGLGKEVFGPKYGSDISRNDYRRAVRELSSRKAQTKDIKQRTEIERQVRYLKRMGGM